MIKIASLALAASVVATGYCKTTDWKSSGCVNNWDWSESGNFTNGAPGPGDTVNVPLGVTVYATNAASWAVVKELGKILLDGWMTDSGGNPGRVVIDVPVGENYTYAGAVTGPSGATGELRKTGDGTLRLTNVDSASSCNTSYDIQGGTLVMPSRPGGGLYMHIVNVAADATLFIPDTKCNIGCLNGYGLVTNNAPSVYECQFTAGSAEYPGRFYGRFHPVNVSVLVKQAQYFLGIENAMIGSNIQGDSVNSILGFAKMGNPGEGSSIGSQEYVAINWGNAGLSYFGMGETSTKDIYMFEPGPLTIDGGPNGGFRFAGNMNLYYYPASEAGTKTKMSTLVLKGDGPMTNAFCGTMRNSPKDGAGNICSTFVRKKGAGVWRFADYANASLRTGFAVENGTLQFESIDQKGVATSLGTAADLMTDYTGAYDASKRCDWAYELGSADHEGVFEYCGAKGVYCTTRPVALVGDARFKVSSSAPFRFAGVTPLTAGAKTVTLDGSGSGENTIADIGDSSDSPVSLVKEGKGNWILANTNALHGSLSVRAGTLTVRNPSGRYSWYRWTVKCTIGNGSGLQTDEFSFYDAKGDRINGGLENCADYTVIRPGEAAYMNRKDYPLEGDGSYGLKELFCGVHVIEGFKIYNTDFLPIVRNDRETWVPIVMRLTNGAPEVASYDFSTRYGSENVGSVGSCPRTWSLEGSVDGLHWDVLHEVENGSSENPSDAMHVQVYPGLYYSSGLYTPGNTHSDGGRAICGATNRMVNVMSGFSSVSVAAGAVLAADGAGMVLDKLTLDAAAGGVRGFAFASTGGQLNLMNLDTSKAGKLPIDFDGATGLDNLEKWTLSVNGKKPNGSVVVRDGGLVWMPNGFMITIR